MVGGRGMGMHGGSGWWAYLRYDEQRDHPTVDRRLLLRIAAWARGYRLRIAIMVGLLLVIAVIELVPPLIYGKLINDLTLGGLTLPRLNAFALLLLAVPIASSLLSVAQRNLSAGIGEGLIFDLRVAMYRHLQRMSLRFFTDTRAGDIISRFASDVVGAQNALTATIPNLITNVLTLTTTLAIMLRLEWHLTLLAVAALPLFLLPTRRVGRILRRLRREAAQHDARMSSQIEETMNVSGALLVRTFGRQGDAIGRFGRAAGAVRDIGIRRAVVGRWFFFGLGVAAAIGTALMYWVGGYLVLKETPGVTAGLIVTFAAYVNRLYQPIMGLTNIQVEFATSLVSFERVFEYLDLPVEVDEVPSPTRLGRVAGRIVFEDVSFTYRLDPTNPMAGAGAALGEGASPNAGMPSSPSANAGMPSSPTAGAGSPAFPSADASPPPDGAAGAPSASMPAVPGSGAGLPGTTDASPADTAPAPGRLWSLADASFVVEPGQVVALVGPSGAGKTTVTYLVARLYDPTRGRITLDGHDLREVAIEDLADNVGMVTQEAYLFHDTVRANLLFARPDATDADLVAACRAANVHDVVMAMPDGYDTMVGERGYRMSGGEKQRLALARVILKDPAVLVLDEATSHLDSQSEALIQDALERVMRGRTSLVIAHRLSTILAADLILVFDAGRVVERGAHADLMALGGLYAALYETQFRSRTGQGQDAGASAPPA
jgi:ATP-binding cassette, subfamily B, bacterial